jgi:hypothetical protein
MSFYTSLILYRPTKPPLVTGPTLARFLGGFAECKLLKEEANSCDASIKFGSAIDQDDKPTCWEEPVNQYVWESRQIDWDARHQAKSIRELIPLVEQHRQGIYRAHLSLGCAHKGITKVLTREPSEENEDGLCLWDWSITLEPVAVHALGSETVFRVGWIRVSIGGNGYLYPWKFKDLFRRAGSQPDLLRLEELCRLTWPVPSAPPDRKRTKGRKLMGELWPYPMDEPVDWCWGVAESG